jgi:pimeloyl-ACP methyl ester carboxylesterase
VRPCLVAPPDFSRILPERGKTHRAIALDLPGYGLSDKPLDVAYDYDFYAGTLDALLDALGIEGSEKQRSARRAFATLKTTLQTFSL